MSKQIRLTAKLTVSLILCLIFNGEPLQNPYTLGFLIAAWADAKITEFSFPETSFHFQFSLWLFFRKPRVCGEKLSSPKVKPPLQGSPPRMRGKAKCRRRAQRMRRITPAYAGKSLFHPAVVSIPWDHPRICGEKAKGSSLTTSKSGSPPHMRGKDDSFAESWCTSGITPAYAGKSRVAQFVDCCAWDHPRICGEKYRYKPSRVSGKGSPPHMRGKVEVHSCLVLDVRITPAYAGKSQVKYLANPSVRGSPPHMRGKARVMLIPCGQCRITPAYAGKSRKRTDSPI